VKKVAVMAYVGRVSFTGKKGRLVIKQRGELISSIGFFHRR